MEASFKKRLGAYVMDWLLIILMTTIISLFIPINENVLTLNKELSNLQTDYLNHQLNFTEYFIQSANIVKDLDQQQIMFYVVTIIVIISYFVIWPFYHNGQTVGKYKLKIKVITDNNDKPTINDLLLRNIIINGLGYLLIQLLIVNILPSESYYVTLSFLSVVQLIILITSLIMIIKNKKGLHDVIVKTKVIEVENERVN